MSMADASSPLEPIGKLTASVAERKRLLASHLAQLSTCAQCPKMHRSSVLGRAVLSEVLLIGQAPGNKEPVLGRPFAWTAGKTMFGWFHRASGISEEEFRARIYMAAVCRCFPGGNPAGGDRVPDLDEIARCSRWLHAEMQILRPKLVIPVGKLAILQFIRFKKLSEVIGQQLRATYHGYEFDMIPLPHPSGASTWHHMEPGKALLQQALERIVTHPAWPA